MPSVIPKPLCYLFSNHILTIPRYTVQADRKQRRHAKFSTGAVDFAYCPSKESGMDYLRNAHLNKGLAFTYKERQTLGIHGLLAPNYKTQKEQIEICNLSFDRYAQPLNQFLYLSELHDDNMRLYYSLINTNVEKFLPIVYTPTVGLACQKFGYVYKKPKGLFITIQDKGRIAKILSNWPIADIRVICVTDGERILGLGDLGAYGMGIPIGKLCLYTALAGVDPSQCLPITLDVGTNNQTLLVDPLYIGLRQKRVRGKEYTEFVDEFMEACVNRFGVNILIQFEDFALPNALSLLARYEDNYCTFNDDIQGTAAAVVAGIFGGARIQKRKISENVYLFLGAGSAATGIADLLVIAMKEEGIDENKARGQIYMFDIDGFLTTQRESGVPAHAKSYGKDLPPQKDFAKAVQDLKPTCIIGASTVSGAFTPAILQQMAKNCDRPMIFALSNPTIKAECTAQAAYDNTEGRCIFASGSPFPPVNYKGKTYRTGQGNNAYIFPGVGLGIISANALRVNSNMFLASAKAVGKMVLDEDIELGRIYPSLSRIREISLQIAHDVVNLAYKNQTAGVFVKPENITQLIKKNIYDLNYPDYTPDLYDIKMDSSFKIKSFAEVAKQEVKK